MKRLWEYRIELKSCPRTPNETRIGGENIPEYYPLQDLYPNLYREERTLALLPHVLVSEDKLVTQEWFQERLQEDRIRYAITYLQVQPLKKYIQKNFKSMLFVNPFFYFTKCAYPIEKNLEVFQEIVEILIYNYDDYQDKIEILNDEKFGGLYELVNSIIPENPDQDVCSICLHANPVKYLLYNLCDCKNPIHAKCAISFIEKMRKHKCTVCLKPLKINVPFWISIRNLNTPIVERHIFFPFHDIYHKPVHSYTYQLHRVTGMDRLTMAISYLQVDRVKSLVEEKEVSDQLPEYFYNNSYKQTPIIALCTGNLSSNCNINYGDNSDKYAAILKILFDTGRIDLNHRDAFGKDYKDYATQIGLLSQEKFRFLFSQEDIENRTPLLSIRINNWGNRQIYPSDNIVVNIRGEVIGKQSPGGYLVALTPEDKQFCEKNRLRIADSAFYRLILRE